jgi:hypothetical protein
VATSADRKAVLSTPELAKKFNPVASQPTTTEK